MAWPGLINSKQTDRERERDRGLDWMDLKDRKNDRKKRRRDEEKDDHGRCQNSERIRSKTRRDRSEEEEDIEEEDEKEKNRDYKLLAAKKKTGFIYYEDNKFSNDDDVVFEKKILIPQYDDDDLVEDECVTLDDHSGRFTGGEGEAERKKLEELLHKRIHGVSTSSRFEEELHSSDYYTLEFKKKPKKKKKSMRKKKEKLDYLDTTLEAAEAYQSAYAKAKAEEESAKALLKQQQQQQQEQFLTSQVDRDDDENPIFGDDDDDLYRSLERAKKIALNKQADKVVVASGPQLVSSLALAASSKSAAIQITASTTKEIQEENKVVFTEMEEFVWGLQLLNEKYCYKKPDGEEDLFVDEADEESKTKDQVQPAKVKHTNEDEQHVDNEMKEEVVLDETIHEVRVGKGLSGALQLLKDRGMLKKKNDVDWGGGRNMDKKKKSKLVGIYENNGLIKEIRIERKDEFGRTMTQKEAYRRLSHIFHGKGPGKMKQEKRLKQYQEELKLMQMKNSDTPSQLMERMRETQARLKLPCIVLSGHVKQG